MQENRSGKVMWKEQRLRTALLMLTCSVSLFGCGHPQVISLEDSHVISREQAIEDVDFLIEQLKEKHPKPFEQISEVDFFSEVQQLKTNLPEQVKVKDFSLSIAALLALIRDDHTRHRDFSLFYAHISNGGKVFPVKFRYKDGQMTVEAWSPNVTPSRIGVGDAVIAVNGEPMESLLRRYGRYISMETDMQRCWALDGWFEKYAVLLGDVNSEYRLKLCDSDGRVYKETLPAVGPWLEHYERSKSAGPRFHYQFYSEGKVCLFKAKTFAWKLRKELDSVLVALLDALKKQKTETVILDLRGNGGGNANMGGRILETMIDREDGEPTPDPNYSLRVKLVLLCDRWTQSAASWLATYVKDNEIGTIAGEESGGRASFFGDIEHVSLPNSGLSCGIATKFFMRPAGYDDRRGVLPDLPLDVTLEDYVLVEEICEYIGNTETPADGSPIVKLNIKMQKAKIKGKNQRRE